MKKTIALMMALMMLLSFAMAETAEIAKVSFAEMVPEDQLALGTYDTLNDDIPAKIWVLNGAFTAADPSEVPEEYASGLEIGIFKYAADDSLKIIFSAVPNDEGTFDDLIAAMKAQPEEFTEVEECVVNGIRAVGYACKGENGETLRYATYEVTDYVWLNIMYKETDNVEFNQAVGLMAASVAPVE